MTKTRHTIKALLMAVAPRLTTTLLSIRSRRLNQRVWRLSGAMDLETTLAKVLQFKVASGPFLGLELPEEAFKEHLGPLLLGTYEKELHPSIEKLVAWKPERIIDVGAKIGYYAAGFALRLPDSQVVAFDTDPWALKVVRQISAINHLDNVSCRGFCSPDWLAQHAIGRSLIFSDCEGFEGELFPPHLAKMLVNAALIIECHDHLHPGLTQVLTDRFAGTHSIDIVSSRERTLADWQGLNLPGFAMTHADANTFLNELRAPQNWLVITPHSMH